MLAQEQLRELCGDRPGLGSSTCIVDAGHVQVETGLSWTRTDDLGLREDVFLVGDTLLRLGLDERTEVQLGFTAFGHARVRTPLAADEEEVLAFVEAVGAGPGQARLDLHMAGIDDAGRAAETGAVAAQLA